MKRKKRMKMNLVRLPQEETTKRQEAVLPSRGTTRSLLSRDEVRRILTGATSRDYAQLYSQALKQLKANGRNGSDARSLAQKYIYYRKLKDKLTDEDLQDPEMFELMAEVASGLAQSSNVEP
jgi:hypothetical protein